MKKFRGKRRYFKNLKYEFHQFSSTAYIDADRWFDDWHTHPDFSGHGNTNLRIRKAHLRIATNALHTMRKKFQEQQIEHQIYMTLVPEDAAMDALHVHTSNPNGTPFPNKMVQSLPIATHVPTWISEFFPQHAYTIHQSKEEFIDYTEDEPVSSVVTLFHIFPTT